MRILVLSEFVRYSTTASPRQAGFTLLEMVVVMALIGLATGLVGPVLSKWFDRVVQRSELAEVMTQVKALQTRAALLSTELHLSAATYQQELPDKRTMLNLPVGWTLAPDGALVFTRSGVCGSGKLVLQTVTEQRYTVEFMPQGCVIAANRM